MKEFIIRTQRTGVPDVFVSRRYGDFRRLAEEVSCNSLLADGSSALPSPMRNSHPHHRRTRQ